MMTDADINAIASRLPSNIDLTSESEVLDEIVLVICVELNIRCSRVDRRATRKIIKRATALRHARAA